RGGSGPRSRCCARSSQERSSSRADGLPSRLGTKLAKAAMFVGLDHRLDEHVAQRGECQSYGDAAERHRLQDRPKLLERRLENAVGEVDVVLYGTAAEHQVADLVGGIPQ